MFRPFFAKFPHVLIATAAVVSAPALAASYRVVNSLPGGFGGAYIYSPLLAAGPLLYGEAAGGGYGSEGGFGLVFSLNPATGVETPVIRFDYGNEGQGPIGGLIRYRTLLYGVTSTGGVGDGNVFALNPVSGFATELHAFGPQTDGAIPAASLLRVAGTLYGTTTRGSNSEDEHGILFSLNPASGAETILHVFQGNPDGGYPDGSLIEVGGVVYGTTRFGGSQDEGAIFTYTPATNTTAIVHNFNASVFRNDGQDIQAGLVDVGGTLYGTTTQGGGSATCFNGCGTVFSFNPRTHAEAVLHSFGAGGDGIYPMAPLVYFHGKLYGTTQEGGAFGRGQQGSNGLGTVFSIDPSTGQESVVHSFGDGSDGVWPIAGLIVSGGTLYGTTLLGGNGGVGTVFAIVP
jgi:uncharacterized repeat protein (TIGR03803 family)